jgi:hypothetical protein
MALIFGSKYTVQKSRTRQEADVACVQGCERPAGGGHGLSKENASRLSIRR